MHAATAYGLVLLTILLTVYGQFAIKWQVLASPPMPADLHGRAMHLFHLFTSPLVLSALAAAVVASATWMLAMTRLPLSHAHPMTALTFVLVVFGSNVLFSEPITTPKVIGLTLIVIGIIVGAQG